MWRLSARWDGGYHGCHGDNGGDSGCGRTYSRKLRKDRRQRSIEYARSPLWNLAHNHPAVLLAPRKLVNFLLVLGREITLHTLGLSRQDLTLALPLQRDFLDIPLDGLAVGTVMIELHHGLVGLVRHSLSDQVARRLRQPLEGKCDKDGRNGGDRDGESPCKRIELGIGDIMRSISDPN